MKRFAVVGLGKFGLQVARALADADCEVLALDVNKARVQAVAPWATGALVADATDRDALKPAGLEEMDAVIVATGSRISVSILACLHLQELGVKHILAKAQDEDHARILAKMGASEIIHPERDMALRVARALSCRNLLDFIPLTAGFELVQLEAPAAFVGKTLATLNLRAKHHVQIIAIRARGGEFALAPSAERNIAEGDTLLAMGKSEDIQKLKAIRQMVPL